MTPLQKILKRYTLNSFLLFQLILGAPPLFLKVGKLSIYCLSLLRLFIFVLLMEADGCSYPSGYELLSLSLCMLFELFEFL